MINLHESMRSGRDQTRDFWICSQTHVCCQTRNRLHHTSCSNSESTFPKCLCLQQQYDLILVISFRCRSCLKYFKMVTMVLEKNMLGYSDFQCCPIISQLVSLQSHIYVVLYTHVSEKLPVNYIHLI